MNEAVKYLRDFGKKVIDSRRSAMEDEEPVLEDYLTCMLKAGDDDSSLTFDDMLDEFVTVFIVGKTCFIYVHTICFPISGHVSYLQGWCIIVRTCLSPLGCQAALLGLSLDSKGFFRVLQFSFLTALPLTCMHGIMQFAVAMKLV